MEQHTNHSDAHTASHASANHGPRTYRSWLPTPGSVLFTMIAIFVLLGAQSAGAVPGGAPLAADAFPSRGMISYQGQLTDINDQPINGQQRMRFALYPSADAVVPLWEEEWSESQAIQVVDGHFNVLLGSQNPITPGAIEGVDTLFLGVQVGLDDEMSPRLQLGGSPFAIQASQALTVPDGSITTAKIANGAVTSSDLANGSVGTAQLAADAVGGAHIAANTVTGGHLAHSGFGPHNGQLLTFVPISKTNLNVGGNGVGDRNWTNVTMPSAVPSGAVAVLIYGYAGDSNATTTYTSIKFDAGGAPNGGTFGVVPQGPHSELNQGIVPLDGSRRISYEIRASGSNTFSTGWKVVGYWAPAHR
jgi:hypothetical protein